MPFMLADDFRAAVPSATKPPEVERRCRDPGGCHVRGHGAVRRITLAGRIGPAALVGGGSWLLGSFMDRGGLWEFWIYTSRARLLAQSLSSVGLSRGWSLRLGVLRSVASFTHPSGSPLSDEAIRSGLKRSALVTCMESVKLTGAGWSPPQCHHKRRTFVQLTLDALFPPSKFQ